MSTLKQLGKGALIYGLQPVLSRLVSIIMLPLYTRLLTPEDYGVLQLLDTTTDIAAIIFTAGAISGVQRFYFKFASKDRQQRLLSTAQLRLLLLGAVAGLVLLVAAPLIHQYALRGSGTVDQVRLSAVSLATGFLSTVPMLRLQLQQRAALFSSVSLLRLFLQLSLNIAFVAFLRFGVTGVLLSTVITNVLFGGALTILMLRDTGLHWDRESSSELERFGRPYRLTSIGSYILNFGDRFFLSAAKGTAQVGMYGLAYQFGFGFSQFTSGPINRAWDPIRYKLANEPPEVRNPVFLRVFDLTNLLLFGAFVMIACFIRPAIQVLTTPAFYPASDVVPVIVAAYLVQFWTEWFTFQINVSEKTQAYSRATMVAAAVTLVLYAVLIPQFGMHGAAWATFGGFSFRMLLAYRAAQSLWPVPYQWGAARRIAVLAVASAVGVAMLQGGLLWRDILIGAAVAAAFGVASLLLVVQSSDRARLLAVIRRQQSFSSMFT